MTPLCHNGQCAASPLLGSKSWHLYELHLTSQITEIGNFDIGPCLKMVVGYMTLTAVGSRKSALIEGLLARTSCSSSAGWKSEEGGCCEKKGRSVVKKGPSPRCLVISYLLNLSRFYSYITPLLAVVSLSWKCWSFHPIFVVDNLFLSFVSI